MGVGGGAMRGRRGEKHVVVVLFEKCKSTVLCSLHSPCCGAAEDAGGACSRRCRLVVMGNVVELLTELRQRLPHASENVRWARREERPSGLSRVSCGVPGL